jgi:transcription initiation factor IIE alpha subunit
VGVACSRCGGPVRPHSTTGICTRTDECRKAHQRAQGKRWRSRNPEAYRALRNKHRAKVYGLTHGEVEAMLASQGGRCSICECRIDLSAAIDHDHDTGQVRGLLCPKCNTALGLLDDNPERMERAASYIRRNRHGRLSLAA